NGGDRVAPRRFRISGRRLVARAGGSCPAVECAAPGKVLSRSRFVLSEMKTPLVEAIVGSGWRFTPVVTLSRPLARLLG
ncbi:MAG TPA: hypothetical protein VHG93_06945, partial [Longimicrobium sp.]|nr:hypothetical protein [Longimicrobium sp.]